MNRANLSNIFNEIDDRYIEEAIAASPELIGSEKENSEMVGKKFQSVRTKRMVAFALAACLLLAIGVAAFAVGNYINSLEMAEIVAKQEIEVWKQKGLLSSAVDLGSGEARVFEFPEQIGNDYWFGRIFKHRYDVRIRSEKYYFNITVDTSTGKIVSVSIEADADEDDIPVRSLEIEPPDDSGELKKEIWYFYENFEDIFSPEITVDGFCSLLAEYWGFSGFTLSDTEDEMYRENWEAVSGDSLLKDMYTLERSNYYLTVFFEGDQNGTPMYIQLNEFPGRVNLLVGTNHAVG